MKEKKRIVIGVIALMAACLAAFFIYQRFTVDGERGEKKIVVQVIHADKSEKKFTYYTDAAYLGEVLEDNKLVEGEQGQYGLFITTADGERAEEEKQQWWCITKDSEQVNTSADQTAIEDGDGFELTLKEGY